MWKRETFCHCLCENGHENVDVFCEFRTKSLCNYLRVSKREKFHEFFSWVRHFLVFILFCFKKRICLVTKSNYFWYRQWTWQLIKQICLRKVFFQIKKSMQWLPWKLSSLSSSSSSSSSLILLSSSLSFCKCWEKSNFDSSLSGCFFDSFWLGPFFPVSFKYQIFSQRR